MAPREAVVIDVGSGICKAGFAGEDKPRHRFPSIIGRPKNKQVLAGSEGQEVYVGDAASKKRGMLTIAYPIDHGVVQDWGAMEKIWQHTFFDLLKVETNKHPVLLTEPIMNPKANREQMATVMFETFCTPALYLAGQAVLSLYAAGRTTGVVLDVGDGVTHVVPVYEGFAMPHAFERLDLAGRELTMHLVELLNKERGVALTSSAEMEIAREIKEKFCFVAEAFDNELNSNKEFVPYEMCDGQQIQLGHERFRCPEPLFTPAILGKEANGVHTMVWNAVRSCDLDIRKDLIANVLLSGGTTMLPGFAARLHKELVELAPPTLRVRVWSPEDRYYSVFVGGSMLADLDMFANMCISKWEYRDHGVSIVHKKCM